MSNTTKIEIKRVRRADGTYYALMLSGGVYRTIGYKWISSLWSDTDSDTIEVIVPSK